MDEEAEGGEGEKDKGAAGGGSGLPWEGDDKRDYKYEELLGGCPLQGSRVKRSVPSPAAERRGAYW